MHAEGDSDLYNDPVKDVDAFGTRVKGNGGLQDDPMEETCALGGSLSCILQHFTLNPEGVVMEKTIQLFELTVN